MVVGGDDPAVLDDVDLDVVPAGVTGGLGAGTAAVVLDELTAELVEVGGLVAAVAYLPLHLVGLGCVGNHPEA